MGKLIDNEPNSGYVSPVSIYIERIRQDAEAEFEKNVLHAVLECGVAVDRDELIKALQYDRDQFQKGFAAGVEWGSLKWISVKDRLPETNELVLVYMKRTSDSYADGVIELDKRRKNRWWLTPEEGSQKITHWMPLPLPPEGE